MIENALKRLNITALNDMQHASLKEAKAGKDVVLINATVGPNVSLGDGCHVQNSTIKNSLVQNHSHIKNASLDNAMIGSHASFDGDFTSISIGDYSVLE